MIPSADCLAVIESFEGLGDGEAKQPGLQAYYDQNRVATCGYGHALVDENGHQIRAAFAGDPKAATAAAAAMKRLYGAVSITPAQANDLLQRDCAVRAPQLDATLFGMPTSQCQYDALFCFAFNVGMSALSSSTLLARHKAGAVVSHTLDFKALEEAVQLGQMPSGIEGGFASWCHAAGAFSLGLFRRRMAEAMLYRGDGATAALAAAWAIK